MNPPLFLTVSAVNYLFFVFTFAKSLRQHIPNARLSVLITDVSPAVLENVRKKFGSIADFIGCNDLGIEALPVMRTYYSILEFNSACKALALDYHLKVRGESECCFVDPDMYVLGDFSNLLRAVGKEIVLTQHAMHPYPDDSQLPNEYELAVSGAINGGVIYVRNTKPALEALEWLVNQTRYNWFVAPSYGMYGDQQWLGFMLQFFSSTTGVLYHPGVNIAYWNLHERSLSTKGALPGRYVADNKGKKPALLFHFSGFSMEGDLRLTRYSSRKFDAETEQNIASLIREYRELLAIEQNRLSSACIAGDLGFSSQSLLSRMKAAEKYWGHQFVLVAPPVGRFALLGSRLDNFFRLVH